MKYLKTLSLVLISVLFFSACVDQEFDEPPYFENGEDPVISGIEKTMDEVKALSQGEVMEITEDWYFKGVVISDDEPGNFYKVMYLQDELGTGGIQIPIDATELHATYPLFSRVFVKLKGLWIGKSNNAWLIGGNDGGKVERIPQSLVEQHLIGGEYNVPLSPVIVKINDLDENIHGNTLVKIEGVQFAEASLGTTYAIEKMNVNHDIIDCNEKSITLRNSGYSDFYTDIVPTGNGSITAVYSIYRDFQQVFISRPSDIDFSGDRCGGGSGNENLISISQLRTNFDAGATVIEEETKIKGVVVSDKASGNGPHKQNIVFQDETGGIEVRFSSEHNFKLNDELEIAVSFSEMLVYRGVLQISNVSIAAAKVIGTKVITGRKTNVADILDHTWEWQSTLVTMDEVEVTAGKFSDNIVINGTDLILFTWSNANFADKSTPNGKVTLSGILSNYTKDGNSKDQIKMRNISDISDGDGGGGGGTGCDELTIAFEDGFDSNISKWTEFSVNGSQKWEHTSQYGNPEGCAKVTGYEGASNANEDWLISPAIDVSSSTSACLVFEAAKGYDGNDLEVLVSTNYSGTGDPSSSTWTTLSYSKPSSWDWVSSGAIDLKDYIGGNLYIGFKYSSTAEKSSTWEIDNVVIRN